MLAQLYCIVKRDHILMRFVGKRSLNTAIPINDASEVPSQPFVFALSQCPHPLFGEQLLLSSYIATTFASTAPKYDGHVRLCLARKSHNDVHMKQRLYLIKEHRAEHRRSRGCISRGLER